MIKSKIIKRKNSGELLAEHPESMFIQEDSQFNSAIIGITSNGRIVYNYFEVREILDIEYLDSIYDCRFNTQFTRYEEEKVDKLLRNIIISYDKKYGEKSPLFCIDQHFITKVFPTLRKNEQSYFSKDYIGNLKDNPDYDITNLRNFEYYRNK
ncbi:hypothetical protein [Chryseobacterium scophthalmum]|uniref:hypothetical protein n=1 Tax=Chryseobacterium scophthalmum TaxID=59733 RepID=UPI001AEBF95A|nr:hypothetical protein [Chryseobacterium scophthalmum]